MSSEQKHCEAFKKSATIVVFGASGDLASKKTFPALFALFSKGRLPPQTKIIGFARSEMSEDKFNEQLTGNLKVEDDETKQKVEEFKKISMYVQGSYTESSAFEKLNKEIENAEKDMDEKNRLFYLALPPSQFSDVGKHIKNECFLKDDEGKIRVVIEKPFGHDLKSSRELQSQLAPLFTEEQIYRIDHYLGKEMVKNLFYLRFLNIFMVGFWSKEYISNVQITFKEPFGTEGRGGYFDDIGIIRDVMQNHLLQVFSLLTMDRPVSTEAEDMRDEKRRVLKSVRPLSTDDIVLGQYTSGEVDGKKKPGYKEDDTIKDKDTKTPTFAAITLYVENERWDGVPFILQAGKALEESLVEIRVQFKPVPGAERNGINRNELVFRVQPNESIYIKVNSKLPGLKDEVVVTDLDVKYREKFADSHIPEAYESLILDCLMGDHSNFVRDDELDEAWKIFTPLLDEIDAGHVPVEDYSYGSKGPAGAQKLLADKGYVPVESVASATD